jgi:hypothetical protein
LSLLRFIFRSPVGICYEYGKSVQKNDRIAYEWYFEKTCGSVFCLLFSFLFSGIDELHWWEAILGNITSVLIFFCLVVLFCAIFISSRFWTGLCFDEGVGTKKNETKAFEWFYRAAEQGHTKVLMPWTLRSFCSLSSPCFPC